MAKQGSLSINSENIFPIIKKWLYSDHDIFIRELVSNGCDAVTKLKKLSVMGEFEEADDEKYKVEVRINPTDKTLTFIDNGIGMTEDEVDEYINQIAFSGAAAFMEQYKDKASDEQIIGHFGLGFYSAFMVADKVLIKKALHQFTGNVMVVQNLIWKMVIKQSVVQQLLFTSTMRVMNSVMNTAAAKFLTNTVLSCQLKFTL